MTTTTTQQARQVLHRLMAGLVFLTLTHALAYKLGRRSAFNEVNSIVTRLETVVGATADALTETPTTPSK